MKIFKDENVYVQIRDLGFISAIYGQRKKQLFRDEFIMNEQNHLQFVSFSDPEIISYFKNCDWIINYDDFKTKTIEELYQYEQELDKKRNLVMKNYRKNLEKEESILRYNQIEFEKRTIEILIQYQLGNLELAIPNQKSKKKLFKKLVVSILGI